MKRINPCMLWLLALVAIVFAASRLDAAQAAGVDVVLWFDTEDYLLPASDDAAKRLAELLSQRGIRATFKVVGEKARVLQRRGRTDVIAALRKHDIGYHSNLHSVHPAPAEYMADCGLLDGVAEFVRHEKQGAADVRRIFGRASLACYGQPGSSWTCQAIVALKEIGVGPVYLDDGSHVGLRGEPFWYAGALNAYHLGDNVTRMDLYNADGLEQGKAKVTAIAQRLAAEDGGLISIYYHPCEFVHEKFWDAVNFSRGANPPRKQWKIPPQRPAEQTEQAFARFSKYIDHLKSLGVRFVTASELPAIYCDRVRSEGLTEAELLGLAKTLSDSKASGVDYQVLAGKAVSPADQFELLTMAMGELIDGRSVSYPLPAKGLLGPDSAPGLVVEGGQTIAWPAFRDAALDVRDYLRSHGRVPARVFIGADSVTPADFLGGLAFAFQFQREHGKLPLEGVRLGKGLTVLTESHVAKDPTGLFGWVIHKPGLQPAKILEVARLQAWTLKPAVRLLPRSAAEHGQTTLEELERMPKIDAHAHVSKDGVADEKVFVDLLRKHNLKWLDICVVGTEWEKLQKKMAVAEALHRRYPQQIAWATSFNLENWGQADWQKTTLRTIEQGFARGAVAVKVWKEIGMVLKDPNGRYVLIDDARFDPILDYIESRNKTLVAHLGEPRNCWLPLKSMTVASDRHYYKEHPQYHAFLHPEIPGYWEQIKARDHVLEKHPHLRVVGCHLGSLEYDVDELAKRLDKYPNLAVDMAARIVHFQVQDREKVRNFLVKYQDRLLYGTDNEISGDSSATEGHMKYLDKVYRSDYRYFATGQEIELPEIKPNFKVQGLALPAPVLKKIYYENALKWYPGIELP